MADALSFYFFDFDKNIMRVQVAFVLKNVRDGSTKEISSSEYRKIRDQIGKEEPWKDWSDDDLFANYRDRPDTPPGEQPFVQQIEETLDKVDEADWKSPAWGMFVHACNAQKPFSLITARGHSDETVRAGFDVFRRRGYIERTPNYLTIFNVTYPPTAKLLNPDGDETVDTPQLKRRAIHRSVDEGVRKYGNARHRFGMSDDTMLNVEFIADAMRECRQRYPTMRFFVISTNFEHALKAEVYPMSFPVSGYGDQEGTDLLESHLDTT